MIKFSKFFVRACMCSCLFTAVISCKQTDDFFSDNKGNGTETTENFNFSTTQEVDLIVDYSEFETLGPVRFGIYATNPVVGENTESEHIDENIKPLLEVYTDDGGKFDQTLSLPAYAKTLHIVTGNLAIGFAHSTVEVVNGTAKVVVKNDGSTTRASAATRATGPGVSTKDMSKLKSTAYEVNSSGNPTSVQIYKEWATELGTWNSASGRPDYQMNKATATPALVLSDSEVKDMYNMVCNILPNGKDNSRYRNSSDLTLKKASEVSVTVLGSFTCWNSTLGYYYYNESSKPTSPMDLNIIMLFPNSQDGQRDLNWNYQGNIGTKRGDAIQLMYYPNIANGDLSGATKTFPAGTKIGFIMRSNAWGMMGDEYCSIKMPGNSKWNKKMNIWASSTDGMSYAHANLGSSFTKPNPNGAARTAEFSYTAANGTKYVILAFEDACDDYDFNDLIFALNPANAFVEMDELEKDKTTKHGVYAFEDRWPAHSDYDMNDVVIDCEHELYYSNGKVKTEIYNLTTYQNYAALKSGLALRLKTKANPSKIVMKKKGPKQSEASVVDFTYDAKEKVYYLTDHVTRDLNTTYIFELTYSTVQEIRNISEIEPFLYGTRKYKEGNEEVDKPWEVHLPGSAPTNGMFMGFFRTYDDFSVYHDGGWYKSNSQYPFAFYLDNATASDFFDTILNPDNESKAISEFYNGFIPWSLSKGTTNADWYLHPKQ